MLHQTGDEEKFWNAHLGGEHFKNRLKELYIIKQKE